MRSSDPPTIFDGWWRNDPPTGNDPVTRLSRLLDWLDLRCPGWQDAAELAVGCAYLLILALEIWEHLG